MKMHSLFLFKKCKKIFFAFIKMYLTRVKKWQFKESIHK